jgi:hypothetical protein
MNVQRFLLANRRRQASGANRSISSFDSSLSISSVDSRLSAVHSVDGFDRNRGREAEAADCRMWEQQYREMEELGVFARADNDSDDDSDDESDDESSISSAMTSSSISFA